MAQVSTPRDRRSVTILFADIVGSTALIEHADAESAHRWMAPVLREMAEVVERYSGHVSEIQGDGLLALFGAPYAIEDHPFRACRAALAIQAGMRTRDGQPKLEVRIGLSCGVVVITVEGDGPNTTCHAVGIPVHLASRVQSKTPPGAIGMSRHVHERVEQAFDTERLGEFQLKGISTTEPIYLLRGLKQGSDAAGGRHASGGVAFVGRSRELDVLAGMISALKAGVGGVVQIEGEPGIGKSRLLAEARNQLAPDLGWFGGHWSSYEQRIGYKPFIDIVRTWLDPLRGGHIAWESFLRRMGAFLGEDSEHTTPYLAALLGIDVPSPWDERLRYLTPDVLGNQVRGAMRRFFLRHALAAPQVIALEDLHWADESSLALLAHLVPLSAEAPLLFLLTTRPDADFLPKLVARLEGLGGGQEVRRVRRMTVGPLGTAESAALLEAHLGANPNTKYLRHEILARTGGNPFFIEELVHNVKAASAVARVTDGTLGGKRALDAVPDTVEAVILARVDRLKIDSRQLLMRAAVIGREFLERVLQMLDERARRIDRHLVDLEHHQFIREVARTPELAYVFCHALTQQTIYDSILLETRKRLHRRVADALESIYAERRGEIASVLAFHYARADAKEKALASLLQAATQAEKMSADAEAVRYYEEALQSYEALDAPPSGWQEAFIRRRLGVLHSRRGNFDRAESYFVSALSLYGDRFPRAGMPARMALLGQLVRHVLNRLRRPLPLPDQDATDRATEQHLRTYEGLAWLMMQTDQDRMLYATLRVLSLSERLQWREGAAKALGAVGFAFNVLGMHKVAAPYHRRATLIAEQGSDLAARALTTDLHGGHQLYTGDWDHALDSFRRAMDLALRIGDLDTWVSAAGWRCILLCERGALGEVHALSLQLLEAGRDTGFGTAERWGHLLQGACLRRADRIDEAEASLHLALDAAAACGDVVTQVDAYGELGVLAVRSGREESGRAYLKMGRDLAVRRRIRIQSVVPIYVGLAEAGVPPPGAHPSIPASTARRLKRRCSEALATATRYSIGTVWALRIEARLHWAMSDHRSAARYWEKALATARRFGARYEEALALIDRGAMAGNKEDSLAGAQLLKACIGEIGNR